LLLFYGWSCDCTSCINGKSRVERPSPYETIRLPLNPMECDKKWSNAMIIKPTLAKIALTSVRS
jgi:hypothetical protein